MKKLLIRIPYMLLLLSIVSLSISLKGENNTDNTIQITEKKPVIKFSEPVFDFGYVYGGDDVIHIFKFKNIGEDTLKIVRVSASCGCSEAKASSDEIAPGESGEIEVVFRTGGYRGRQEKNISVYSNDPINPVIYLQLKGNIKLEVEISPRNIMFGNIPKHRQVTKQFQIIQRGENELLIEKVKSNKEYLKIDTIKKKRGNKNIYWVKVTLDRDAPVGDFRGRIEISTNLKRHKKILVGVQGKVLGDINLSPERVSFRGLAGSNRVSSVVLSSKRDKVEILGINNNMKYISTEVFTLEKFKKYRVDFNIVPGAPAGAVKGKVTIYTDYPGETELAVPVSGEIIETNVEIGYFFERGCLSCERVHSMLEDLRVKFPAIVIKEYNIEARENMKLNESLCEVYDVLEEERMVTPAIFIGKDFLIGEAITKEKVIELIDKYEEGISLPLQEATKKKDIAEHSIINRFRSFGVFTIIGAGLLDGVNPCAFATIIFLISYLAIIKRKGYELILVGIAFTLSVFITYLLIGIGIFEFLKYLTFLKTFTIFIYVSIGALTFILGILSLIDYFKCRRGEARDILLQLPDFLKKRIHTTIKEHAGFKRYVFAAFITGFIVSILELSCTGQVYLPTIVYATGISKIRFSAYMYLLLYNLMFIVPLIVIFILAYLGTTSIRLSDILGKNITLIKLLTSILFFVFTAFMIMILVF